MGCIFIKPFEWDMGSPLMSQERNQSTVPEIADI